MPYQAYYVDGTYAVHTVDGGDRPLRYYAVLPTRGNPMGSQGDASLRYPTIVYCQGSGWHQQWLWHHLAHHARMAERGFAVISVEVRPYGETVFPGEVEDFLEAARYVREHADELRVDTSRIAFWGDSSGAHTALMAAYTAPADLAPRCVVDFYGPADLELLSSQRSTMELHGPESPAGRLLGGIELAEHLDKARAASPVSYVSPDSATPPTLIFHGSDDPFLPFAQSVSLYERLRACGKEVEFYCMEGDGHGEGQFDNEAVLDIVEEFVRRHMA
jgi:acetyl esterase/lipase